MSFTWGVCSSRLTLKRQRTRREEGRSRVSNLGQIIREIQRDAAALPTAALRTEIEILLDVQDAAIGQFYSIRPGSRNMDDLIVATSTVMLSVLTTALYVRELTTRPRPAAWAFTSSIN
jgi:hypothetical protein